MNKIEDFKIGEKVVLDATEEEAIVVDINIPSTVLYVRCLISGELKVLLNPNLITRMLSN